jgi:sugar phosphate isomerase/epimerase
MALVEKLREHGSQVYRGGGRGKISTKWPGGYITPVEEIVMKLCTSSWSFPHCTLEESVAITKALGFEATDLGYVHRPALDKRRVLSDTKEYAAYICSLGIAVPTLYHLFGESLLDRNLARADSLDQNIEDFRAVTRFCKAIGTPVVFVIPGIVNPGQTREDAFQASSRALRTLLPIARDEGIAISIEPHVHSYLESPSLTLRLLEEVEGVWLTLDYSHFLCLGYRQEEIDPLMPFAAHVHLRQARPGVLQAPMGQGTLNIGAFLGALQKNDYKGYIALEVVHQEYMNTVHEDVLTEIISLRDFCRECFGQASAP